MITINQEMLKQALDNLEGALSEGEAVDTFDNMTQDEAKDYVVATLYSNLSKLQPPPTL